MNEFMINTQISNPMNMEQNFKIPNVGGFKTLGVEDKLLEGSATYDAELVKDLNSLNTGAPSSNTNDDVNTKDIADAFSNVLNKSISSVSESSHKAHEAMETFASGGNIDIHSVMIASEKANLNMQLTLQVRNKVLQAYKEISNLRF